MIDFTYARIDMASNYGGSDQKRGVIYEGKRYMLKMSDRISEENRTSLNSSYSNSVYSEYVCCHVLNTLGFAAQNTLLGVLTMTSSKTIVKDVPVVACENFIPDGYELVDFKVISNAVLTKKPGRFPKINEIYEVFLGDNIYFTSISGIGKIALERFWNLFILDAFLGNFDRHARNWAYLINRNTYELEFAPIYDCGSCLYPQLADDAIERILLNEDEIIKRIDKFPNSALLLENGNRINYKAFISSFCNKDCTEALLRIYERINLGKVCTLIDSVDDLSYVRKEFYKKMLTERYNRILKYSFDLYYSKKELNSINVF